MSLLATVDLLGYVQIGTESYSSVSRSGNRGFGSWCPSAKSDKCVCAGRLKLGYISHLLQINPLIGLTNQEPELVWKLLFQDNWTCKYLCCSYSFLSSFSVSIAFLLLEGIYRRQNIISLLWLIMLQFIFNWDTYSWMDARQLNSY